MAVHFIATRLLGHIATAASFRGEEFRPAINQNTAAAEIGAGAARSLIARVLFVAPFRCRVGSLRLIFPPVINTKSEAASMVAAYIPLWGCRTPAVDQFIIVC